MTSRGAHSTEIKALKILANSGLTAPRFDFTCTYSFLELVRTPKKIFADLMATSAEIVAIDLEARQIVVAVKRNPASRDKYRRHRFGQ